MSCLVLGCSSREKTAAGDGDERVEIGAPLPNYLATSLDGDSVSLAALRGKVTLLNVWATWCHPCRTEIPELQAIHERYRKDGLQLIGVSVDTDGTDDAIRTFMRDFKMTFPIWRDADDRISAQFLIVGVPATFLIDKAGVLRWRKTGPITPNDTALSSAIARALGS
ncbi:MAG: TlpA family protein disulfide reductase [Phycisphaerae bacterium]|nr:TlpA family protein disulfide reductase [Gemmatimonadaceae bacterium]